MQLESTCLRMATPLEAPRREGVVAWRKWGEGPPLVLLHGGSGSWRHWARTIPHFAATRTVHVPDLPGLGDSDALPEPSVALVAAAVTQGLSTLLAQGVPFDLVGFSFGTTVAGHVAAALPGRVRTLVLASPGAIDVTRAPVKLHKWRGETDVAAIRAVHRKNLAALMIADPARIDELAVTLQLENAERARLKSRGMSARDELLQRIERMDRGRVHAVFGERDAVIGPNMHERIAALGPLLPPGHLHIMAGAGHWLPYECADEFNALLERLLAD